MNAAEPVIYTLDQAPAHILFHIGVALAAVALGAVILLRKKGTPSHKVTGWIWVTLMLVAAAGSFWIQARGRLSLIHLFSVAILIGVPIGVYLIRNAKRRAHQITMTMLFIGLCITGLFTLLPYRMLGQLVFR